jgi:hypothetical protein
VVGLLLFVRLQPGGDYVTTSFRRDAHVDRHGPHVRPGHAHRDERSPRTTPASPPASTTRRSRWGRARPRDPLDVCGEQERQRSDVGMQGAGEHRTTVVVDHFPSGPSSPSQQSCSRSSCGAATSSRWAKASPCLPPPDAAHSNQTTVASTAYVATSARPS